MPWPGQATTRLVVAMHANNETGVIQPLEALARIAHEAGAALFSDAVQTAGKIWFIDRMALLYDDVAPTGSTSAPPPRSR